MRATIIGANSYIARNLICLLREVHACDQLFLYDIGNEQKDGEKNYEKLNILSKDDLSRVNFDVDAIYMFVGKTGSAEGFSDPDVFLDINERALLYVLNEYVAKGSKARLIFPSTRLLYDHNSRAEEKDVSDKINTVYAVNKLACEKYIEMYHNVFSVNYTIVRICIPYGTLIPDASSYGTAEFMMSRANKGNNISLYGDGKPRRTLTYIGDLCSALIKVAENGNCKNEIFNIGGEDYSLSEMAELIADSRNVSVDYVDYPEISEKIESGDTVFNDCKLKSLIGDYNKVKFKEWVQGKQ